MKRARTATDPKPLNRWETAESHSSSDVLAILAPTAEEPEALHRAGIWKNGTVVAQAAGSAA